MINFPVLKELKIEEFELYPGKNDDKNLAIDFRRQGLSLVVGANGLGKTTLINLVLRLLTGPYDLGKFDRVDELGNLKLVAAERPDLRSFFSSRVKDGAQNAKATLIVSFGEMELTIVRSLSDLALLDLKEGLSAVAFPKQDNREHIFQKTICQAAKISDFGDWLLILHYIIFYQEDRRALVWDSSAQREILRILVLDSEESLEWKKKARNVLELDSEFRNLRSAINKEIKKRRSQISATEDRNGLRSELESLTKINSEYKNSLSKLNDEISIKSADRSRWRESLLRIKSELDSELRDLEHAKLIALESVLPGLADTSKFILSQLMADDFCLACNNEVPNFREELEKRLSSGHCLICGSSSRGHSHSHGPLDISSARIKKLSESIKEKKTAEQDYKKNLDETDRQLAEWNVQAGEYKELIRQTLIKSAPIEAVLSKVDGPVSRLQAEIGNFQQILDEKQKSLQVEQIAFHEFLHSIEEKFLSHMESIQRSFNQIVQEFLVEDCEVSWKKVDWRLGQEGKPLEFPAFVFKMRSGSHQVMTERRSPAEVSESQREFIDLSFRIALIRIAAASIGGSIIMDAPESSLDAVFVERAASIFTGFSRQKGNALLLASNLVDGDLLPRLLSELYLTNTLDTGLINLFEVGVPSKAVVDYQEKYKDHFESVKSKAKEIADAQRIK
ncbi:AAA family ATPase [Stutzerimonas nitrititolerans]|uniref:AAA family ATPase n=1 Tax=Stutzerimonas nitrititolerans TaxID=2482751 RepID=UPI00289FFEB6|nr:AAA family ATPase [Stutzerimonas nitrititolerans]